MQKFGTKLRGVKRLILRTNLTGFLRQKNGRDLHGRIDIPFRNGGLPACNRF